MFFANFYYIYTPPHGIHGWKATDLSLDLAPSDQNLMHPTNRQNFGDGPGQTPKLILTLCRIGMMTICNCSLRWLTEAVFGRIERTGRHFNHGIFLV